MRRAGIGNHESGGSNRKHFSMRFAGMQFTGEASGAANAGNGEHGDQLWWSFDAGLVHYIAVNTGKPALRLPSEPRDDGHHGPMFMLGMTSE